MQRPNTPDVDWTGVEPDRSTIAPLDSQSFVTRLHLLGERASSLRILREALARQQSHDAQPSRDSKSPSR